MAFSHDALQTARAALGESAALFPLEPGGKRPLTDPERGLLHGQHSATTDADVLTEWADRYPDCNWGVLADRSGLYIIDVDDESSWAQLERAHGVHPTMMVTTPRGGRHLYYALDPARATLTNTASRLAVGIDTRGNGYTVAPGSRVNGTVYEVTDFAPPAPLPQWVIDAVLEVRRPLPTPAALAALARDAADTDAVRAHIRDLAETLAHASEGEGNETAARVAWMAGQYAGAGQIDAAEAVEILRSATDEWVWRDDASRDSLMHTIERQTLAGTRAPRPWAKNAPPRDVAQPDHDAPSERYTDQDMAEWLLTQLPPISYTDADGFLVWNGSVWAVVEESYILSMAATRFREHADLPGLRKPERRAFEKRLDVGGLKRAVEALRYLVLRDAADFDSDPYLLNTPSGVVDLRTGETMPHTEAAPLLITRITEGSYRPGYTHADWEQVLTAVPEEARGWLQARLGVACVGEQIAKDVLFLQGDGSNGKSLLANDGVVRAMGGYATIKSSDFLAADMWRGAGASPDIADLRGRRIVLVEETPSDFKLNTNAIKRLAGTNQITARKLYKDPITFSASHDLLVATNHHPRVTDGDWGVWRRLSLLEFRYRFTTRPTGPSDRLSDLGLDHRIRWDGDGQWDAIITWLVEGCIRGLREPEQFSPGRTADEDQRCAHVASATHKWRGDQDVTGDFIDQHLVPDPMSCVTTSDVLEVFTSWTRSTGQSAWSNTLLMSRLMAHPRLDGCSVQRVRTRNRTDISRPALADKPLAAQAKVIIGVRWALPEDDE